MNHHRASISTAARLTPDERAEVLDQIEKIRTILNGATLLAGIGEAVKVMGRLDTIADLATDLRRLIETGA